MGNIQVKIDKRLAGHINKRLAEFTPEAGGKRTKRVQLVMTPELYERTKASAEAVGISFNEFVNQLCDKVTR